MRLRRARGPKRWRVEGLLRFQFRHVVGPRPVPGTPAPMEIRIQSLQLCVWKAATVGGITTDIGPIEVLVSTMFSLLTSGALCVDHEQVESSDTLPNTKIRGFDGPSVR